MTRKAIYKFCCKYLDESRQTTLSKEKSKAVIIVNI